ncbi:hypothetical protein SEPCBS57363_001392 [Sporothrix epigloea]|uniref:PAS domain-containing protein n=1 Tax=Sporothrix epigloea TaxID=1892477 RepID=A0ABP0DDU6_9PEZI
MSASSRKSSVQRPATAVVRLNAGSGYEFGRPHLPTAHPNSRGSKISSKSERCRSLPDQAPPPTADFCHEAVKVPEELAHLLPIGSNIEKGRHDIAISPSMTVSGAHSPYSERGRFERSWDRAGSNSSAEDILSLQRLRSNSGLSLHTNSSALRRYTDYNADGSTRLPPTDEHFNPDGQYGVELDDSQNSLPGIDGAPAAPKLLSWEMVEAVFNNPEARERLMEYTHMYGGTENLEFLQRVEQYNKALHSVTALMANISTTFTCMTAKKPLNLPPQLSRSLNADIKHVSSSILPGLEMLYSDVNSYIKERVLRDIYPNFVQHQLAICMKSSLGAVSAVAANTTFSFKGLGSAFCLTDPYRPDNPVVYASDAFAHVLGYNRSEDIPRTGLFFRGPELDNGDSFVEDLILTSNHRNNRPFWSLVSGCPLKTASGRVRFVLSGLVDVSEAIKSQTDIVNVMSAISPPNAVLSPGMGLRSSSTIAFSSLPILNLLGLGPAAQEAVMYHDVFAVLSELAGSPSISPVFRAKVRQHMAMSEPACLEFSIPASGIPAPGAFSAGLGPGLASPTSCQTSGDESSTSTTSRRSSLLLSGRSKRDSMNEEKLSSPGDHSKAPESRWSGSSGGHRCRSGTYDGQATVERRVEQARLQRLVSHWTPLKDADGTVAWVILVISPVVEL